MATLFGPSLLVNFLAQSAIAVAASAVINAIFPTRIEGPRLNDLTTQASTYGNAIPLLLGQAVRVAGNVIWSTGLQETKTTESAKGGPQVTSYSYKVDCAISLGERPGGIAGILKIWGFGKLIYDATLATGDTAETPQGEFPTFDGGLFDTILGTLAVPFGQGQLLTQAVFESITVYPGNFTQMPDPTMEAALGVGNVPAYRGTAYVVIKGLQLADFGNVLPNLEFLVIPNPEETVGDAVKIIVERAGITEDQYRICDADPQKGYVVGRVMTASAALAPLAFAHQFDMVDDAGLLRLIERDEDVVAIISTDDLAGHSFGEERPDPIQWERAAVTQLPKEASVTFSDPARDFQENSLTARRSEGTADSNISIELAITLEADDARALADRALWEAWLASQMAKVQSTDRLIDMLVGRVYLFETPAGLEALRVFSKTRGRNGVIEFELRRERGELYSSPNTGTSGSIPPQEIAIPGPTELVLLDMPMLRDADDDSGFYFGVVGSETGWRGSAVMRALSISEDFITFQSAGVQSVVGDVQGTLPDGPTELDGTGTFDEVNTLTVELRHAGMTLESVSDEAIEAGANAAYVCNPDDTTEGEVIQFGVATLITGSPVTYELSHLRRGKRGTEFATSLHGSGEIFVRLQQNGATMRRDFGVPDLDLERLYKAVSLLLNPDDVDYIPFTNTGVGLRPYSPIHLDILGNSVGELVLVWERRSRLDSGVLGEATELYTVRIMNALGTVIIREEQVTEESFTYTEAMQIADFGEIVTSLRWRVAQVSAVYGNGIFSEFNDVVVISSGALSSAMLSSAMESDAEEDDMTPLGRLTLQSGKPVMTADQSAKSTVYYTAFNGGTVPVWNGASWVRLAITGGEISMGLDAGVPRVASGSLYDIWAINNGGSLAIGVGPAWASATSRGTGGGTTEYELLDGLPVNANTLTNLWGGASGTTDLGPIPANEATLLGTLYATANGQTSFVFMPAAASGGSNNVLGLSNAFNRVRVVARERDSVTTYNYNSTTWRSLNNSASNRITFVDSLQRSHIAGHIQMHVDTSPGNFGNIGMNLDSTSAAPELSGQVGSATDGKHMTVFGAWAPQIGLHYIQGVEAAGAGNPAFIGNESTPTRNYHGMVVELDM